MAMAMAISFSAQHPSLSVSTHMCVFLTKKQELAKGDQQQQSKETSKRTKQRYGREKATNKVKEVAYSPLKRDR